jgi:prepilin-type processing-associated H-X9-DG protein
MKQLATGCMMYIQDYDETALPGRISYGGAFPNDYRIWPELAQPYIKNWQVARCPSAAEDPFGIWNGSQQNIKWWYNWMSYPAYGYNWNYLTPTPTCNPWRPGGDPTGIAAINKPAETVLFTDTKYVGTSAGWFSNWYVDSPAAIWAPDCCTYSNGGWGRGSWGDTLNYASNPTGTGQFAPRHTGGGNVAFCDGHVKFFTPGSLAAGTNWRKDIGNGAIQIIDRNQYLWDLQ